MGEAMTCYERDETLCEDQMCLRVGCRIRNDRLSAESKMPARIWARDLDGTGSMHPCAKGDPGAVEFIRADLVEPLVAALRASQAALTMMTAPKSIMATSTAQAYAHAYAAECKARAALSSWEAASHTPLRARQAADTEGAK